MNEIGRIRSFAEKWEGIMALPDTIEHIYIPHFNKHNKDIIADTSAEWEYRSATIRWYLGRTATLADTDLEITAIHELSHVLLAPMESHVKNRYTEQAEFAVENTARLIKRLYEN
jgi:hypothetical protein